MSVNERLQEDMKQAMKDKEAGKFRLSVIRMVRSSIKNAEIDRRKELTDEEVIEILARELKLRRDAAEEFQKGNRPDLVDNLEREIGILMEYMPAQLSAEEIRSLVIAAIAEVQAGSPKDMGKVMNKLMPAVKGRADGKLVNSIVRELLPQQ